MNTNLLPPRLEIQPLPLLYLRRERLIENIKRSLLVYRTMILVAPAGYGKSALVTTVVQENGLPYFYYRFAPNEDIGILLESLMNYLALSLDNEHKAQAERGKARIRKLIKSSENITLAISIIVELFAKLPTNRSLLIFDDYHYVDESSNDVLKACYERIIIQLIRDLSQNIRIIITNRRPNATLKDVGSVIELSIPEFDLQETKLFLSKAYPNANFPFKLVDKINKKLEGWPLGLSYLLQLVPQEANLREIENAIENLYNGQPLYEDWLSEQVFEKLNPEEKELLIMTSVVTEMNGEICLAITETRDAEIIIDRLARQRSNFVFMFHGNVNFWYRCHDLFRNLLRKTLSKYPEKENIALLRAANYYKLHNLWHLAIDLFMEGKLYNEAFELLHDFGEYHYQNGKHYILLDWIMKLLTRMRSEKSRMAWLFFMEGRILERTGNRVEALIAIKKSADLYREVDDLSLVSKAINKLGTIKLRQREYFEAKNFFLESYRIRKDIDERGGQAQSLYGLGDVYWHLGNLNTAKYYLQESLLINKQLTDKEGIAIVEVMLGKIEKAEGNYSFAYTLFSEALQLNREINDIFGVQIAESFIGEIALLRGRFNEALEYINMSLQSAREMANTLGIAINTKLIGEVFLKQGKLHDAKDYFDKAISYNNKLLDRRGLAIVRTIESLIPLYWGDYNQAVILLEEAAQIGKETSDSLVFCNAHMYLSVANSLRKNFKAAKESIEEVENKLNLIRGLWSEAMLSKIRGIYEREKGEKDFGEANLQTSKQKFESMDSEFELAWIELELAETYLKCNKIDQVMKSLESANKLIKRGKYKYLKRKSQQIFSRTNDVN